MRHDLASIGIFRFDQDETKSIESGKSVSDSPSLSLTPAFIQSQICGGGPHLNGNAEIVMTEISSIGAINDTDIVNTTSDLQKELVHY